MQQPSQQKTAWRPDDTFVSLLPAAATISSIPFLIVSRSYDCVVMASASRDSSRNPCLLEANPALSLYGHGNA